MPSVFLVIHDRLPTYSMYFREDNMYSEPIETVNTQIVAVYTSHRRAQAKARRYFRDTLGYSDNGESENGGYYYSADGCETWDEEVYVVEQRVL
mmetsp:Transcript_1016/g.2835  ORF Transcript_1016/g.2835 Transcript_1016/m.2835 type:complete len:94 (-) Transcript_1016:273-554(-)